jgi:hypothetical protein
MEALVQEGVHADFRYADGVAARSRCMTDIGYPARDPNTLRESLPDNDDQAERPGRCAR